jgi:hypothetical protein
MAAASRVAIHAAIRAARVVTMTAGPFWRRAMPGRMTIRRAAMVRDAR